MGDIRSLLIVILVTLSIKDMEVQGASFSICNNNWCGYQARCTRDGCVCTDSALQLSSKFDPGVNTIVTFCKKICSSAASCSGDSTVCTESAITGTKTCNCAAGYAEGQDGRCQVSATDECSNNPCGSNYLCRNVRGGHRCECKGTTTYQADQNGNQICDGTNTGDGNSGGNSEEIGGFTSGVTTSEIADFLSHEMTHGSNTCNKGKNSANRQSVNSFVVILGLLLEIYRHMSDFSF